MCLLGFELPQHDLYKHEWLKWGSTRALALGRA